MEVIYIYIECHEGGKDSFLLILSPVFVCVCVCVCVRVYVVYEDTNLYNDMGMTEVLQYEGGL